MFSVIRRNEHNNYHKGTQDRLTKKNDEFADLLPKSLDTINAKSKDVTNPTGIFIRNYRSEGSLNQHLKIKHPDIFRTLGVYTLTNNPPVKESDDEDESL